MFGPQTPSERLFHLASSGRETQPTTFTQPTSTNHTQYTLHQQSSSPYTHTMIWSFQNAQNLQRMWPFYLEHVYQWRDSNSAITLHVCRICDLNWHSAGVKEDPFNWCFGPMMVRFPGVTSSAYISIHGTKLTFCKRVRYISHTQIAKAYLLFHLTTQILQIMKIVSRTKIQQTAGDFD